MITPVSASNTLWGGPYPLAIGDVPPTVVKVWFNTTALALQVYDTASVAWHPVSATVNVGSTPPAMLGQLWLDEQQKLWVRVDDLKELTEPIVGSAAVNGAALHTTFNPPQNPSNGQLWFEPQHQDLSVWNGCWKRIGRRVQRSVRTGSYAVPTWNAGGNRSQGVVAGNIMYISGIRGISPSTQKQVPGPGPQNTQGTVPPNTAPNGQGRIIQIYENIKAIVEAEGISLFDCFGLVTSLASPAYLGPTATCEALPQFWGNGPYPPRTHQVWTCMSGSDTEVEFNIPNFPARGDIVEVQAMFWTDHAGRRKPTSLASEVLATPGVKLRRP
jgi:enamine deaminase RidA (YjgF/YER057c/UK114 family)